MQTTPRLLRSIRHHFTSMQMQRGCKNLFSNAALILGLCAVGAHLQPAQAQTCSFSTTSVNFGTVDLTPGTRIRVNGTLTATCNGTPGQRVRICLNFGSGTGGVSAGGDPRQMLSGPNSLNYNLFKNSSFSNIWGSNVWAHPPTRKSIRLRLNGSGTRTRNIRVRGEIYASQPSTPSGLYTSNFAGAHTLIAYAYNSVGNCNAITALGGVQVPFTVQANVVGACTLTTTNMNFGTAGILNSNQDTTGNISITCSTALPYSIGLDGGLAAAPTPTTRKLMNGANEITYGIYQDASRSIEWGNSLGTNTISATGNGSAQNFTTYGRIPPQPTPLSGTYSDTIVVTVTY